MASSNPVDRSQPPPAVPDDHTTVIVVVFVSLGCLLFLAFFAFVLCFLIRKKSKKRVEETETVHVDEHLKMKEAIVDGPHGPHAVVLSVEDDVRIEDKIQKEQEFRKGGSDEENPNSVESSSNSGTEQYYSPIRK